MFPLNIILDSGEEQGWQNDYYWFEKTKPKVLPRKWTYEACRDAAKQCSSRSEFVKKHKGAYEASRKNGWLDEFIPEKMVNHIQKNITIQINIQFVLKKNCSHHRPLVLKSGIISLQS